MTYVLTLLATIMLGAPQSADKAFAATAAQANMAEIRLGQLAEKRGRLDTVKMYGSNMIADHTRVLTELRVLCKQKATPLPTSLASSQKSAEARLSRLTGRSFDMAYSSAMVANHQRAVALFSREAKNGKDAAMRQWAAQKLSAVKDHLKMAKEMHKQVVQSKQ